MGRKPLRLLLYVTAALIFVILLTFRLPTVAWQGEASSGGQVSSPATGSLSVGANVVAQTVSARSGELVSASSALPTTNLSSTPAGNSTDPALVVDSQGNLHAVWSENDDIVYSFSLDRGIGWFSPTVVAITPGFSRQPTVATDPNGTVHVAWSESGNILYSRRTVGSSWTSPLTLASNGANPSLAADSQGRLHLIYTVSSQLLHLASTNGGVSWSPSPHTIATVSGLSVAASLAVDTNDNLHLVWADVTASSAVFYSRSTNQGANWSSPPSTVYASQATASSPSLTLDGSGIRHVVWADTTGSYGTVSDIFYSSSSNGQNWTSPANISRNQGTSSTPSIAVDSFGTRHVVWADNTGVFSPDIFYSSSSDGQSWTGARNISDNTGASTEPVLRADGSGNVHLLWQDTTTGVYARPEIYYGVFMTSTKAITPITKTITTDGGVLATDNGSISVVVPSGGVTTTTQISLVPQAVPPAPPVTGTVPLVAFSLEARDKDTGQLVGFTQNVTITVRYRDEDIGNINEETLGIYYLKQNGQWEDITIGRDMVANKLFGLVTHLSDFAILGEPQYMVYLPDIPKRYVPGP